MGELKCPFCNQELIHENMDDYWCTCNLQRPRGKALYGNNAIWQELISTRNALDIAVDALKLFYSGQFTLQPDSYGIKRDASCLAHTTLAEITALEQKEE